MVSLRSFLPLCLVALSACADDPDVHTVTREDALEACLAYREASCRKMASCRGEDEQVVELCLMFSTQSCSRHVDDETCWEGLRDGYEDCLDIEDESCDALCGDDGKCIHSCEFVCPEADEG